MNYIGICKIRMFLLFHPKVVVLIMRIFSLNITNILLFKVKKLKRIHYKLIVQAAL